jgi:hypothetical protein
MTASSKSISKRIPHRGLWEKEIAREYNQKEAEIWIERVQARYDELFTGGLRYKPSTLQKMHFENRILPAIAAFEVLLLDGKTKSEALLTIDRLMEATMERQKALYKFWGRFPFFFDMLRLTIKPVTVMQFPTRGWRTEFLNLGPDVIAINEHSCFYMNVLTEYGLPELTAPFCHLDDFLFNGVTRYVRWERTQTIAQGGEMCDFRYFRT